MKTSLRLFLIILAISLCSQTTVAQDTVSISWDEFLKRGLDVAAELDAERQKIRLAENRVEEAQNKRWLPKLQLTTNHGLVPGVNSDSSRSKMYLDPSLENDWSDWSIFTQLELRALQPIYTWGALDTAVAAAREGAEVASHRYEKKEDEYELRLFRLYQSRILAIEMQRLLEEAEKTIQKAEKKIAEMQKSGDSDLDQSEVYKFDIYKYQFFSRAEEARASTDFVERAWHLAMGSQQEQRYMPEAQFLDPLMNGLDELPYYQQRAAKERPEVKAISSAEQAAKHGYEARKAERWPILYLGLGGEFVNRPRPVSDQPLFGNRFTYANVIYSFGFRQNLDFGSVRNDIEKNYYKYQQARHSHDAIQQGVVLEVNEQYKNVMTQLAKKNNNQKALQKSKEWLRQEEIDFDLGLGDIKVLIDAVRTNLEIRASYIESLYKYNMALAKLYQKAGLPLKNLKMK